MHRQQVRQSWHQIGLFALRGNRSSLSKTDIEVQSATLKWHSFPGLIIKVVQWIIG